MSEDKKEKAPRRPRGTGRIFRPKGSRFWWVKYYSAGKAQYESTGSTRKKDAEALLNDRLGDARKGIIVTSRTGRLKLSEGLQAVLDYQTTRGRKSIDATKRRIEKHLLRLFAPDRKMASISGGDVERYRAARMAEGAKLATTNRELAILRQAFRLAKKHGDLVAIPHIETPAEENARQGFFERDQFEAVCDQLPAEYAAPLRFAYVTGWRFHSEVLALTADRVDLERGTVRLDAGMTKNGKPRVFVLTKELRRVLEEQLASIERLKEQDKIVPFVFHRSDGSEMRDIRKRFKNACRKAGCAGKMFHDFRRTAVRNLERAGVPRTTAMAMVGHETEAIYRRYAIQDETTLREGAALLDAFHEQEPAKTGTDGARVVPIRAARRTGRERGK